MVAGFADGASSQENWRCVFFRGCCESLDNRWAPPPEQILFELLVSHF